MVACFHGFMDMVHELHNCPFLDINHQDSEGNTALMIASQAGESSHETCVLEGYLEEFGGELLFLLQVISAR